MKGFTSHYRLVRDGSVGWNFSLCSKRYPIKVISTILFEWRMVFCRNKSQEMKWILLLCEKKKVL